MKKGPLTKDGLFEALQEGGVLDGCREDALMTMTYGGQATGGGGMTFTLIAAVGPRPKRITLKMPSVTVNTQKAEAALAEAIRCGVVETVDAKFQLSHS